MIEERVQGERGKRGTGYKGAWLKWVHGEHWVVLCCISRYFVFLQPFLKIIKTEKQQLYGRM